MNLQELIKKHNLKAGDEVVCVECPEDSVIEVNKKYKLTGFNGSLGIEDFLGIATCGSPLFVFNLKGDS